MKKDNGKNFTRKRSLTLDRLVTIIIRCSPYSLQIKLDDYFKEIGHKEEVVTKQALSKARTNVSPETIKASFELTTKTLCECEDLTLYNNKYRICAFDGTDIALDNSAELLAHFGGSGRNADCAMALVSLCYDPLNNIVLDGGLYPYGTSEREAARNHFKAVAALPLPKNAHNLYIGDRGYPSKELFAEMIDGGMFFLMRVRAKFSIDFDRAAKRQKTSFRHNGKWYRVRVFNHILPSGEAEQLVTNVPAKYLKAADAPELYFDRWKIETKFDSLKYKLELENMSGRRVITTYQDFWAKLDLTNTMAALEYATNEVIDEKTSEINGKYAKTTNENRLVTKFSEQYIYLLSIEDPVKRTRLFEELVADITKYPVEIKPDRSSPRSTPRKKKFCDRRKRVLR